MEIDLKSVLVKAGLEDKLIEEIQSIGRLKKVKEDQVIVSPEAPGTEIPFVIAGLLKVLKVNEEGSEVFLYYLEGGETCAMSITCCIEGRTASFKVIAELDSTLWMIPASSLDSWVTRYESFRKFVFSSYHVRFNELLNSIDSVVFHRMDERLYRFLLDTKQATGSYEILKTHEQIAQELNSSRVVISRLLKQLEREGKIEQYRNRIDVL